MVGEIYELKNKLIEEMMRDVQERGVERLDKERVDMVKDLAEAEKSCWEAEYYRSVAEAMEGQSGYDMSGNQMGYNSMPGAQGGVRGGSQGESQGGSGSSGWRNQYGSGRSSRRGYGMGYQEHLDALRMEMRDPQQKEQIMRELRNMGV